MTPGTFSKVYRGTPSHGVPEGGGTPPVSYVVRAGVPTADTARYMACICSAPRSKT
jgi:hypothetical protein